MDDPLYTLQEIYDILVLKTFKFSISEVTGKKWRVKFGGFFLENPPYFYQSIFLPATILPAILYEVMYTL